MSAIGSNFQKQIHRKPEFILYLTFHIGSYSIPTPWFLRVSEMLIYHRSGTYYAWVLG